MKNATKPVKYSKTFLPLNRSIKVAFLHSEASMGCGVIET